MATAFQDNAFENDAFQIDGGGPSPPPVVVVPPGFTAGGGGGGLYGGKLDAEVYNERVPYETAKKLVERWFLRIGSMWIDRVEEQDKRPSSSAIFMDMVSQSPEIRYILDHGRSMSWTMRLIEDVREEHEMNEEDDILAAMFGAADDDED